MTSKDIGIVIANKPIFEKDKQADIFFEHLGRQKVLIKHAQSFRSAKGRLLQPFTKVLCVLHISKGYLYLKESDVQDTYEGLGTSYDHYVQAGFLLRVMREAVVIGQKNSALYHLLDKNLKLISQGQWLEAEEQAFFKTFLSLEGVLDLQQSAFMNKNKFIELLNSYTGGNINA